MLLRAAAPRVWSPHSSTALSEAEYHRVADGTLDSLAEKLEVGAGGVGPSGDLVERAVG